MQYYQTEMSPPTHPPLEAIHRGNENNIWESGYKVVQTKNGYQVEITTEQGIAVVPASHILKSQNRFFRRMGYSETRSPAGILVTLRAAIPGMYRYQPIIVREAEFLKIKQELQNISKRNGSIAKTVKEQLLATNNPAHWIQFGSWRKHRFIEPSQYESQSLNQLYQRSQEIMKAWEKKLERPCTRAEKVRAACAAVHEVLPYTFELLPGEQFKVAADNARFLTAMIKLKKGGVCRHQGPVLSALLNKMQFNTYLIWHGFKEDPNSSHVVCFVDDVDIKAFVHPGPPKANAAFVPAAEYGSFFGKTPTHLRYRKSNGSWQELDWKF